MSDTNQPQVASVPAPGAPTVTYREPEDYADLRAFFEENAPVIEALRPHYDEVRPILEDPEYRELWKGTKEVYDIRKDGAKPRYSPEMQMLRDEVMSEFKPLREDFDTAKKQRETEQAAAASAQQEANKAFGLRLGAEHPELVENNAAGMYMLASYAARENLPLEEAWKRVGPNFSAPPKKATPPTSLRADIAQPGVPGPSSAERITNRSGLKKRLVDNLRASGMKG